MANLQFNAAQVAPSTGVQDPVPAGWYNVAIDKSEMKPTKSGTGSLLELRFNILDGQYAGRKLFTRLNLVNPNAQAVEIAYRDLSAICHATGYLQIQQSSEELHNRPLKVKVSVTPADGQYEASNDIKAYKNINEQTGPATGAPTLAAPPSFAPPPVGQPPQGWAPPPQVQAPVAAPPAQWQAPQGQPPVQQPWAQPQAPQPAAQPPQPQAPQGGPPAWTPPPGAVQQPWAQTAPPAAQPPQQQQAPVAPAGQPQPWQPAPAGVQQPAQATPPWSQPR